MLGLTQSLQSVAQIVAPFLAGLLIEHGQLHLVGPRRGCERRRRLMLRIFKSNASASRLIITVTARNIAARPVLQDHEVQR